jgi:uracil-DNA glycosylase family 4
MGGSGPESDGAEALSALEWWLEAGVDVLVAERPRNWLEERHQPAAEPQAEPARQVDPSPETLGLFREWLASATGTPGGKSKPVLPKGEEGAEVMLIAEAPGREEASAGMPIAGEAAALAERMLAAIGLTSAQAYFANLSCFYSPGAKPTRDEFQQCAEAARRHVTLARPKRLLLLGDAPARALLGKSLTEARGHVHRVEGVRTVVTFHPRFLLDRPSDKGRAWEDLLLLMDESR